LKKELRRSYAQYCGAVDLLEQKLQELGAEIVHESLKFEYNASDAKLAEGKKTGQAIAGLLCRNS
jgi:flavodoxin I